jgi:hypothetical protein
MKAYAHDILISVSCMARLPSALATLVAQGIRGSGIHTLRTFDRRAGSMRAREVEGDGSLKNVLAFLRTHSQDWLQVHWPRRPASGARGDNRPMLYFACDTSHARNDLA